MKKAGFFKDEIYTLKSPNDKKARLAFCDMDGADGYENNAAMESTIGYVNHMPTSELVMFSAYTNVTDVTIPVGEYIHYDHFFISSDAFDLKSGTFKAPFRGIYEFTITDHNNVERYFSLKVEKNGSVVYSVYDYHSTYAAHLSSSWILSLEANDEIRVLVDRHSAFSDPNCYRSFTGKLIEAL